MKIFPLRMALLPVLSALMLSVSAADSVAHSGKPVLLYSRYFNAQGEARYLPDGTFKDVLNRLGLDYEVRVHNQPLNAESLKGVKVVLIANPSEHAVGTNPAPHHVSARDVDTLTDYVRSGGGLMITGNQENHNLEIMDLNKLIVCFGLTLTNAYTDAKLINLDVWAPGGAAGLRWGYYTGNLLLLDATSPARPVAIAVNDVKQKPAGGPRNHAGVLMAAAQLGRGRVVVSTDTGWLTDTALDGRGIGAVAFKDQDNWEICRRLVGWLAGK